MQTQTQVETAFELERSYNVSIDISFNGLLSVVVMAAKYIARELVGNNPDVILVPDHGMYSIFLPMRRYASTGTSVALCPCLSVSLTSRCSIERNERINLVFGAKTSFDQYYTVF